MGCWPWAEYGTPQGLCAGQIHPTLPRHLDPLLGTLVPSNWVPVTGFLLGSGFYFEPFPGPAGEASPGDIGCFLGNHRAAEGKLSVGVVTATLVIFVTAVIAMVKGGMTMAGLPQLRQMDGGGMDTELLSQVWHGWPNCAPPGSTACPARLWEALASC